MKKIQLLITALLLIFPMLVHAGDFTVGNQTFLLNGQPFVVKAAEVHYPRIPRPYWEHRIKMCKALGMNTLCIYGLIGMPEYTKTSITALDGTIQVVPVVQYA